MLLAPYAARIALALLRGLPKERLPLLAEARLPMRIWPTDIDFYLHLNNGAYLTLMDVGRYQMALRIGLVSVMIKRNTWPVLGGVIVRFRRELRLFEPCELVSRVLGWDAKWLYIEQRFEKQGTVHALAIHKVVMRKGGRSVPFTDIAGELGWHEPSPPLPDLGAWEAVLSPPKG